MCSFFSTIVVIYQPVSEQDNLLEGSGFVAAATREVLCHAGNDIFLKIVGNFSIGDGQHCTAWLHFVPCSLVLNYKPAGQQNCSVHIALPHNRCPYGHGETKHTHTAS